MAGWIAGQSINHSSGFVSRMSEAGTNHRCVNKLLRTNSLFFHNVYTLQIAYTNEIWWPIGFHGMFEVWLRFGGARDGWRFWRSESCTDSIRSTKYSWVCQCMISNNLLYNVWFAWSFISVELNHSFTSDLYMYSGPKLTNNIQL